MTTNDIPPKPVTSAHMKKHAARVAEQHQITEAEALHLVVKFVRRERDRRFVTGWWQKLLDAQFQTCIGPYGRIRCGEETHLVHLVPNAGSLCHECGCASGEYHVFGCDAEECAHCGEQAFCCDCDDGSTARA